ncbi:hypothetical protein IGS68_02325 [Skermanella sp. TT6]|uniref:Uncharacterized protein n=1 Tax=Skermanella cutis TaxID=2775420 RepID=A0ABX7B720_9PROT|nr:hypothetical protein [Skermanella sp. TT6]QQP90127.1 hypothetical protein IGS68_02325 [Skermanella sp. TT6]
MGRDWPREWQKAATAEQRARNVFLQAQERALHMARFEEGERAAVLGAADGAYRDWTAARAALDAFVADWRQSVREAAAG